MNQSKLRKLNKIRLVKRGLIGVVLGAAIGIVASQIAGASGSQCFILCNQTVAIPYFSLIGLLISWR